MGANFGTPYDPVQFQFNLPVSKGYSYLTRMRVKCGDVVDIAALAPSIGNVPVYAAFQGVGSLFSVPPNNLVGGNAGGGTGFLNLQPSAPVACSDSCDWEGLFYLRSGGGNASYSVVAAVDSNDLATKGVLIQILLVVVSLQIVISEEPLHK